MSDKNAETAPRGDKGRRLADHLQQVILSGRLAPGQRLIEADLTRDFGVSRSLLREAFRRLASQGLVEIVPNRGAMVRRLSRCEAVELFEIRTELEAFAARRAAGRMADPCIRQIFARAIEPIRDDAPRAGFDAYVQENQDFHRAILMAAGNAQLVKIHDRLQLALLMAQIRHALAPDILQVSLREHRAIADAILAGDAKRAESRLRAHLDRATELMRITGADAFRSDSAEPATLQIRL